MTIRQRIPLRGAWCAWALGASLAVGYMAVAPAAHADELSQEDRVKARAIFQAGLALEAAGDWAKALQKFQEVAAIKATPQTLFHQGRCLEHLGRWTEALGMYRMAIDKADDPKLADVRAEADSARRALEARLPKLVIRLGKGFSGATVSLDGVTLGATSLGTPMLVDPGPHKITASVPGKANKAQHDVTLAEGEQKNLMIETEGPPPIVLPPREPAEEEKPAKPWFGIPQRTGYIIAGAGAASVLVGGVFYYLRQGTITDLDDSCLASHCPASKSDTADNGKLYTHLGNGFFVVGLLGGAFGTVVIFKGRPDSPAAETAAVPAREVNLSFGAGHDAFGATLRGAF